MSDRADQSTEGRLLALLRASSTAVFRMNPDWRRMIHLDGAGFLADTTVPDESWLDRYIPPADRPAVLSAVGAAVRGRSMLDLEHRVVRADGSVGWAHSRAVPMVDARGEVAGWSGIASDATARKESEAALREGGKLQAYLLRLSDALRPIADPVAIQDAACRVLGEHLGVGAVQYSELDFGRHVIISVPGHDRGGMPSHVGEYDMDAFPSHLATWMEGRSLAIDDVAADVALSVGEREGLLARSVRAALAAPLVKGGTPVAVLAALSDVPRPWTPGEVALIEETAERTRSAVELARLRRRTGEHNAFLVRFSDAARPLTGPCAVSAAACRLLAEELGVERAYWAEVDWDTREFVVGGSPLDPSAPAIAGRFPLDAWEPFSSYHLAGLPVVVDDTQADPRIPPEVRDGYAKLGVGADLAVPVLVNGRLCCVLAVNQRARRHWTPEEVALVQGVAGRCWAEVERARAEEALRRSQERLRDVLDSMAEGFALFSPDFTILDINAETLRLDGRPRDGLVGRSHWEAFPGTENSALGDLYRRVMRDREPGSLEHRYNWPDGRQMWVDARAYPTPDGGVAVFWRDITGRKRAEERERFLLTLSDALRPSTDPEEINTTAARILGDHLRVNRAFYAVVDGEDWLLGPGFEAGVVALPGGRYPIGVYGRWTLDLMRAGEPLAAPDIGTDPRYTPAQRAGAETFQVASEAAVPLVKDGELVALLVVHSANRREWPEHELALLAETAERTWAAVERARSEAALRRREAELARVQRIGEVGGIDIDIAGGLMGIRSPEYLRLHGLPPDTVAETHADWLARVHPDDRGPADDALRRALVGPGDTYEGTYRIVRPADGRVRWIRARADVERDAEGRAVRLVGAHLDVTDQKHLEEALRESNAKFRSIANLVPDLLWSSRPDGSTVWYNQRWGEYTGQAFDRAAGWGWADAIHPDEREASARRYAEAVESGRTLVQEHRIRRQDGEYRWFLVRAEPVRDEAGHLTMFGSATDIHDRRTMTEALRASEEKYRTLFESIDEGFCTIDVIYDDAGRPSDFRYVEVNPAFEKHSGFADAAGRTIREMVPDHDQHWFDTYAAVAETGEPTRFEQRGESMDRWWDVYAFRLDGRRLGVIFQDVSERRAAEAALRASEERLRLALSAARMGTWTWDVGRDEHHRDANLNALLGQSAEDTVRPLSDFLAHIHPPDRAMVRTAFGRSVNRGRPLNVEFRVVRPDGRVRWLRDQGDVFGTGGQARMTGACVDITDLKEAEAGLKRYNEELEARVEERTAELSATLESLGLEMGRRRDLARQLSTAQEDERQRVARDLHDTVGQLLAGLALALKGVELAGDLPTRAAAELTRAQGVLEGLGRELHGLAVRLRPTSLDDFGLGPALQQLVAEWSGRSDVRAEFQASGLGPGRLPAEVETTIYRVVQESLTNVAKHAKARVVSVVVSRPDGHVSAVIEDDGAGFDPNAAPPGRLGLVGMRERVDLVGGELEVESSPGSGTTIFIRVPLPGDADRPTHPGPNPPA